MNITLGDRAAEIVRATQILLRERFAVEMTAEQIANALVTSRSLDDVAALFGTLFYPIPAPDPELAMLDPDEPAESELPLSSDVDGPTITVFRTVDGPQATLIMGHSGSGKTGTR